jgi:hypothetical protein
VCFDVALILIIDERVALLMRRAPGAQRFGIALQNAVEQLVKAPFSENQVSEMIPSAPGIVSA